MEITIEQTEHKPLLHRTEITARIFFTGPTPARLDVASALAKKADVKQDTLVVRSMQTAFGDTVINVDAVSYDDADAMKRLERANLLEKHVAPEPEPSKEPEATPDASEKETEEDSAKEAESEEGSEEADAESAKESEDASGEDSEADAEETEKPAE